MRYFLLMRSWLCAVLRASWYRKPSNVRMGAWNLAGSHFRSFCSGSDLRACQKYRLVQKRQQLLKADGHDHLYLARCYVGQLYLLLHVLQHDDERLIGKLQILLEQHFPACISKLPMLSSNKSTRNASRGRSLPVIFIRWHFSSLRWITLLAIEVWRLGGIRSSLIRFLENEGRQIFRQTCCKHSSWYGGVLITSFALVVSKKIKISLRVVHFGWNFTKPVWLLLAIRIRRLDLLETQALRSVRY